MPGIGLESATLAHPRPSRRLSGDRGVAGRRAILQPGNDLFFVYTHNGREARARTVCHPRPARRVEDRWHTSIL